MNDKDAAVGPAISLNTNAQLHLYTQPADLMTNRDTFRLAVNTHTAGFLTENKDTRSVNFSYALANGMTTILNNATKVGISFWGNTELYMYAIWAYSYFPHFAPTCGLTRTLVNLD